MIKLKDILNEARSLSVFDFDDTLAFTDSWIYVKSKKGEYKLDSAEFAVHKLKPGEEYDFRDFDRMLRSPKIIKRNVELLKKQLSKIGRKVTILTARAVGFPVKHFFKTLGIDVYVVAVGSADPKVKADWIEDHIKKGYNPVYFMDDSPKNIKAVDQLKKKYPKTKIVTHLVKGKK